MSKTDLGAQTGYEYQRGSSINYLTTRAADWGSLYGLRETQGRQTASKYGTVAEESIRCDMVLPREVY
jgi:hypothetical protein